MATVSPGDGESDSSTQPEHSPSTRKQYLLAMSLTALGIAYGDIGTSPLYALRESFHASHGLGVSPANVLGVLSLIFWSLILVISIKYVIFVVRADNHGEGGILALTALVSPILAARAPNRGALILLGVFGTALLYGDGMITPAISVLSAVEGLGVLTPVFSPYIIPITVGILVGLFAIQHRGTASVARVFGPITCVWFLTLAALGVYQIMKEPGVLQAVSPTYGYHFFVENKWRAFVVLGSVFLVVTGGESLYSDLGHIGALPIRLAWFIVVLPALLLNYFGQGALVLQNPEAVANPFYLMAPKPLLLPLVLLATSATVIASQALITGIFSLTMQATQLGFMPRVQIRHTSKRERGQIYISGVNWLLFTACVALVIGFQSSSRLAAAYGVAVTSTMLITTLLFYVVARDRWKWNPIVAAGICGFFLLIEVAFWAANIIKVPHGGWFPIVIAVAGFLIMTTWKEGRRILAKRLREKVVLIPEFVSRVADDPPPRVPGTAVFMTSNSTATPPALLHSLRHFGVLHDIVVLLSIETAETPYVAQEERLETYHVGENIYAAIIHYGFMEEPDVPAALTGIQLEGRELNVAGANYVLGREHLVSTPRRGMPGWREKLFISMSRNARSAASYFKLPAEQVVELGIQVEL